MMLTVTTYRMNIPADDTLRSFVSHHFAMTTNVDKGCLATGGESDPPSAAKSIVPPTSHHLSNTTRSSTPISNTAMWLLSGTCLRP